MKNINKLKITYKNTVTYFSSYSEFYRWVEKNKLFASKTNKNGLNHNCSKVVFIQKDNTKLILEKNV